MKIIIAGDGETGSNLARMLSVEGQDIVLIGSDRRHLEDLEANHNFITCEGSPISLGTLDSCGTARADLFVAVTPDEAVNMLACGFAKALGAAKCVARIDDPELTSPRAGEILRNRGVDRVIYPERLAAEEISGFIDHNWVADWFEIGCGELLFTGVRMCAEGSLCGMTLRDIPDSPRLFHVCAIRRGADIIIPDGSDRLMCGDTVYFSLRPENVDILPALCGREEAPVRHIMISGAGRVTENLLEKIGKRYNVTVFDSDAGRCAQIAARFPDVVTVNAPANDVATLEEEGIARCGLFIALTGSSEANIVSCMVAREHGVARTVARIEELQYIPEAESLSIDKIINKKLLNAGRILSELLADKVASSQFLTPGSAEVTCLVAQPGSKVVSKPVAELSLPRGITMSGLIRDGKGQLVVGNTRIQPGDQVVILFVSGTLRKVERLFS